MVKRKTSVYLEDYLLDRAKWEAINLRISFSGYIARLIKKGIVE